jgi:K+-transporting ATPase ATPase C chain
MEADRPSSEESEPVWIPPPVSSLTAQLRPFLVSVPLLTFLTGALFPLALMALAWPVYSFQAGGSLIHEEERTIGSELIGQGFQGDDYFHSRPSAAGDGYDGTASGGTNLAPSSPTLQEAVRKRALEYRRLCELPPDTPVPVDAVTCSGSGLDPHISPANAQLQARRVLRHRRGLSEETLRRLIDEHTLGPQLGFLGQPRVAVLPLNQALDRIAPRSSGSASR